MSKIKNIKTIFNHKREKKEFEECLHICPFCDGIGKFVSNEITTDGHVNYTIFYIECERCHCRTPNFSGDYYYQDENFDLYDEIFKAINTWNRRPYQPSGDNWGDFE